MRHLIILTYVNKIPLYALYSRSPRFESWLGHLCSELGFNAVFLDYLHEIKQSTFSGKALYLYTAGTRIKTTPSAKQQPHNLYSDHQINQLIIKLLQIDSRTQLVADTMWYQITSRVNGRLQNIWKWSWPDLRHYPRKVLTGQPDVSG
jgi:hypothetical protein